MQRSTTGRAGVDKGDLTPGVLKGDPAPGVLIGDPPSEVNKGDPPPVATGSDSARVFSGKNTGKSQAKKWLNLQAAKCSLEGVTIIELEKRGYIEDDTTVA